MGELSCWEVFWSICLFAGLSYIIMETAKHRPEDDE